MDSQATPFQWVTTTSALLAALRTPDNQTIWVGFDQRYRGILERFAQRLGLGSDDAADVAQQTLVEFARDFRAGKYQRDRGRLSAWIVGIARHRAIDALRARQRRPVRGSSALPDQPDDQAVDIWEEEQAQEILRRAFEQLRGNTRHTPRTLAVFEQVAIRGTPPGEVAATFDLCVDEVYRIKNRVTGQLRAVYQRIAREYE